MKAAPGAYGKRKQSGDRTQGFLLFISGDRYMRDMYVRIVTARCVRKRTFA